MNFQVLVLRVGLGPGELRLILPLETPLLLFYAFILCGLPQQNFIFSITDFISYSTLSNDAKYNLYTLWLLNVQSITL